VVRVPIRGSAAGGRLHHAVVLLCMIGQVHTAYKSDWIWLSRPGGFRPSSNQIAQITTEQLDQLEPRPHTSPGVPLLSY
jgi:hypothetical protein